MRRVRAGLVAVVAVGAMLSACGSGNDTTSDGFETFLKLKWEVDPGEEEYFCLRKTFNKEVLIGGFEAIAPVGTHHTVVTVGWPDGASGGPDGLTSCNSFEHHFDAFVYQSSTGPGRLELPEGLAARIEPGQQVILNVHIYNTTDDTLKGTTGTKIKRREPEEVDNIAKATYMGPVGLELPARTETTQVGGCEMTDDVTLVALSPHMHTFGTHMKVTANSSIVGSEVIHDAPYDYDVDHVYSVLAPEIPMKKGDVVEVQCTYNNYTDETVYWGLDSWTAEMCFAATYIYPAEDQTSACGSVAE